RTVTEAFICAYVRTPFGRYAGALAGLRPDAMAAHVLRAVTERSGVDPAGIDDVILGCANQAGEDNRNVARMATLLAGFPVEAPAQTVNRLCGSSLQALNSAAEAIWRGQGDLFIAGGVESMTRSPVVTLKRAFVDAGSATAGNSSGINDGASAMIVASTERARALGLEPIARVVSTGAAGVRPDEMGLGPIPASRKALWRAKLEMKDMA